MDIRKDLELKLQKLDVSSLSDEQLRAINRLLENPNVSLFDTEEKYRNIFENIQTVYYESSVDGIILEISPAVETFTQYNRDELIGSNVFNIYYNIKDRDLLFSELSKSGFLRNYPITLKDKDNSIIYCSLNCRLVFDTEGRPQKVYGAIMDMTPLHYSHEALKISEERYRELFENANDIILTSDLEGNITSMNPVVEKILGYKFEEEKDPNLKKYLTPESYKIAMEEIGRKISRDSEHAEYEIEVIAKNGKRVFLELSTYLKYNNGEPSEIFGIARDITERKKTTDELNKTREMYKELFEATNDIIYTMDFQGNFTSVNPVVEEILGYKFEELTHFNMTHYISKETAKMAFDNISKKLRGEKTSTVYEVDFVNNDGSYTRLEINSSIRYKDGKPFEVFGIARNISEREEANEALRRSEEKYRTIFENAPLGIMTSDSSGRIIEINPTLLQILGSNSVEETRSINIMEFGPLVDAGFVNAFRQCIKTGKAIVSEGEYTSKWDKNFFARVYTKPLKDSSDTVNGFQVIVEDITEGKLAENKIMAALSEKEVLLRELHHRVKNNMQIIVSLINIQMQDSDDPVILRKFKELQQRVRTMSIIHEDLYISEDLSKINFGNYLQKLANNLLQIYHNNFDINLKFDIADVHLSIDTAIPCGLIVNELLSNSFKHAFPDNWISKNGNKNPQILVEFKCVDKKCSLSVSDNGIGMPGLEEAQEKNTLGLVLVEVLVNQLKGTLKMNSEKGTRYEIEIERENK